MYFVATQFSDSRVQELFDVARLIVEGDFARRAHVTLRGPYKSKGDIRRSVLEKEAGVIVLRKPGTFFSDQQNTVFLGIEILDIANLWYKPDYPEGTPHLTLYDRDSRDFSWAVFRTLRKHPWKIRLNSARLSILDKKRTVEDDFLDAERFPAELLERFAGQKISAQQVRRLSDLDRIVILDRICQRIHQITQPSSAH